MASDHYRYHYQHGRHRGDSSGSSSMSMPQTPQQRDSHDLSLSRRDVTRDSLVTNMLLSLDQFSFDQQQNQNQNQQLQQQQSPFDHRSHWDPSPSNHSPGQPQHQHQLQHQLQHQHHNHRYHQALDGAPLPWAQSSSSPSARAQPAQSFPRSQEANSYRHHRDRGHSYSSLSSNQSTPPNTRRHNPDKAAASNGRATNTSSSASSSTATTTQREQVGAANANLQAALAGTPVRSTQKQKQRIPPVTPPARGASLSSHDLNLDQRPSRARRVPKHLHDGYHQFLTETAPTSATASSSSRRDPTRRSKSAGGSSSRHRAAAAAASGANASSAHSRPPLPLAPSSAIEYDVEYLGQDYGAAPTPTIPAGPRRRTSNLGPRGASFDHLPPPGLERKQSSRTLSLRSVSSKNKHTAPPRDQQKQRQQQQKRQPQPPMPDPDDFESAPAPNVGYRKTKDDQLRAKSSHAALPHHQHHPDLPHQQPPQKERPGFFRRVFGGGNSSRTVLAATEQPPQPDSPHPPPSLSRPQSGKLIKEQSKSTSEPPSRDTSSSHSQQPPPVPPLQKKTSSFFRRRKKSVVDDAPPLPSQIPPIPNVALATLTKQTSSGNDDASPVSSLRQALDPYLRNSNSAGSGVGVARPSALADITNIVAHDARDDETDEPRSEFKREFSPDYEPSPNAKIRSVPSDTENVPDSPSRKPVTRTKKSKSAANQTFLNLDNGSDDDHAAKIGNSPSKSDLSASTHSESSHVSQQDTSKDDTIRASKMAPRVTEQLSLGTSRSRSNLRLPSDGDRSVSAGSTSTDTDYKSVLSVPPSVRVEDLDESDPSKGASTTEIMQAKGLDEPLFVVGEPTEDDRLKAKKIYDGLQDFIPKDKAAAWMGEEGLVRKRTLQAYMELYSFTDQSILSALRSVCGRLILRAETQQVDRILVAFSKRWRDCNPNHGFKATDIIHTICYSIMLLNTDLHMADIETKMTRSQFVKNTLSTIRQALHESNPDAFQRPSILPDRSPMMAADSTSGEQDRSTFRHSFRPPPRLDAQGGDPGDDSGPLVRNGFTGTLRAWEEQIELVLKSIYAAIRDDRLPLFGAEDRPVGPAQSQSNLSVMGLLKRTPSVLSKAPSESQISARGRITDGTRTGTSRWTSKSRSRPGLGRNGMASSRTSFDDDNSLWSPAMSSATWSRYSLGRTQASMSQDSFASSMPRGDYQRSIGFANALSQSIIRDEDLNGDETAPSIISSDYTTAQILEDESLELAGPPWIKEGMVVHKHHLDGVGKRAKDRNWSEVFAVVQKGQLSMFSFNLSKSARHKVRPRTATAPVGGGNWQDNAVNVGTFNLRLTLASALPSPGYSRTRPYVWALSLPTGAVHLFQVGTPEIIREFVNTANYWSARLSSHPLVGGISNIEYGWSEAIVNNALVAAINESSTPPPSATQATAVSTLGHARKGSTQSSSVKSSSLDHSIGGGSNSGSTNNSGRGKLPGDRVHIAPWSPPTQSARPSNLPEDEQRETLAAYVRSIESDLQAHNQLRSPMLLAYTPRGTNAAKAMTNWESKSSYLLREIVKFRTYVDCLNHSETRKREVYKERELAQRAARGDLSEPDDEDDDAGANDTLRPQ